MTDRNRTDVDCREFRLSIYHLQADELPQARRQAMQEHLDRCPACASRLEIEDGLRLALKARLQRAPLPPGLQARLRTRLAEAGVVVVGRRGIAGWLGSPAAAVLAAALLLGALIVLVPSRGTARLDRIRHVEREVLVVDLDCDRMGRGLDVQRRCPDPTHLNALKLSDGSYWSVGVAEPEFRWIVLEPEWRGHRMVVDGKLYPANAVIELRRARDLGLVVESARARAPSPASVLPASPVRGDMLR